MERKVGEIFEYNGEWYQCIVQPKETEGQSCSICSMNFGGKCPIPVRECAMEGRSDGKSVIFKKLEKVGEPIRVAGKLYQKIKAVYIACDYCSFYNEVSRDCGLRDDTCFGNEMFVEIKQNKEDMNKKKLNLKEFDLEAAKAGKPVCTRDGRKARIICFDRKISINGVSYPIIALVEDTTKEEIIYGYNEKGRLLIERDMPYKDDLMMLLEKKEGWINIYTSYCGIETGISVYETEEIAKKDVDNNTSYLGTIKIEWEE